MKLGGRRFSQFWNGRLESAGPSWNVSMMNAKEAAMMMEE